MTVERVIEEAEARQLPSVIAEWLERDDALHWVARALQLDLPLLIERPALVLPCLYRRCGAFDAAHYRDRAAPPFDGVALAALIDGWLAKAAPRRWLRALRPPHHPLEAGVVEEYRSSIEGGLRFSADGAVVGIVGKDTTVAWERATGRKLAGAAAVAQLVAPRAPRWTHERATGRILLHSSTRRWDIAVRDHESVFSPVELSDDLVIVSCSFEDDPYDYERSYAHYLVDVATGRIVWRADDTCFEAVLVGDAIVGRCGGIVTRDAASGAIRARHAIPYARAIAFGPRGAHVATHDQAVVRIWELASTPATVPTGRARGGKLSPDGTRVLAGESLWDAHTGAFIADIPFSGRGNWLEGGPPANAWSLVNRRVVQVLPFDTRLWDAADGSALVTTRDVRAGASDAVLADPHGRYLAIHRRRGKALEIYTLDDAAQRFATAAAIAESGYREFRFGWTDDGDALWWETTDGAAHVVDVATWQARTLAAGEAVPEAPARTLEVVDGVVIVDRDLVAPMDSTTAVISRDRRLLVGADHYRVVDPEA